MLFGRFAAKIFWAAWRLACPFLFFEDVRSPAMFAMLFVVSEWFTGWYLAFNFQASDQ